MRHLLYLLARIRIQALVILLATAPAMGDDLDFEDHIAEGERIKSTGVTYEDCDILYLTGDVSDLPLHAQCTSIVRAFHKRVDKQTLEIINNEQRIKKALGGSK